MVEQISTLFIWPSFIVWLFVSDLMSAFLLLGFQIFADCHFQNGRRSSIKKVPLFHISSVSMKLIRPKKGEGQDEPFWKSAFLVIRWIVSNKTGFASLFLKKLENFDT